MTDVIQQIIGAIIAIVIALGGCVAYFWGTNWLLDKFLSKAIKRGKLIVTDHDGKVHEYGPGPALDDKGPVRIRLTNAKAGLSTTVLADLLDLRVANGRLEYRFNFATVAADNVDAAAPDGAVYVRPYLRTFSYGTTQVEVIEVTDLSLASDWSPDVTALQNEIAGLTQRLDDALARIETLETT